MKPEAGGAPRSGAERWTGTRAAGMRATRPERCSGPGGRAIRGPASGDAARAGFDRKPRAPTHRPGPHPEHVGSADLGREVDAWRAAGREVTLWWRDDDAVQPSRALARLLGLQPGCPLGLAVIPAGAQAPLADVVTGPVDLLVHGFAHVNHAGAGERKSEYPQGRGAPEELRAGRERLEALFGDRVLPIFVPPWNRMGDDAAGALPFAGYKALSGYRGRPQGPLPRLDTHVDLIDWRHGRRFAGAEAVSRALADALAARRRTGDHRPTGVLSHHLVHDAGAWRFLEALLAWGAQAPGVRWVRPRDFLLEAASTSREAVGEVGGGAGTGEANRRPG